MPLSYHCRPTIRRFMEQDETANGLDDSSEMMLASEKASLLASAFEALEEKDQYDAVLTGLCAKLLDKEKDSSVSVEDETERIGREATLTPTQLAMEQLKDPIRLLSEMNLRNVRASSRSLMALVDVSYSVYWLNSFLCITLQIGTYMEYLSQRLRQRLKTQELCPKYCPSPSAMVVCPSMDRNKPQSQHYLPHPPLQLFLAQATMDQSP